MDPSEISRVKAYLEFVGKIEKTGLERDFIFQHFTVGSARPLISLNDDETRTKALNYVVSCLKRGERVTRGELQSTITDWLEKEGGSCSTSDPPTRSEKLENSKIRGQTKPGIEKERQIEKPDFEPDPAPEKDPLLPAWCLGDECGYGQDRKDDGKLACGMSGERFAVQKSCPDIENRKPENRPTNPPTTASQLGVPQPLRELGPIRVVPVAVGRVDAEKMMKAIVEGYFTPKEREAWNDLKKIGKADSDLEMLGILRDDAFGRLP
jgi:hypothetical protein